VTNMRRHLMALIFFLIHFDCFLWIMTRVDKKWK
jgi:hypothetical protein